MAVAGVSPGETSMGAPQKDQVVEREADISRRRRRVRGILSLPAEASAVVAFAHGSGSGRFSPRNQFVARKSSRNRDWEPC